MLPSVLVLLLVAMIVGVVLVVVGLKGRRINDHPVCKQCHFDLLGTYPEVVTCPECGSGLKRDNAVLQGARKKMPIVATVGVLLVLTPLVPVGAVAFTVLTGSDVNSIKPLGLILWEARRADPVQAAKLADEVMNRLLGKKLSPAQYQKLIETVLDVQGDRALAWSEGWGSVIDRAELDGVLTPAQKARYAEQAAVLDLQPRPKVYAGGVLPAYVTLLESRVAANAAEMVHVTLKSATLDGKGLDRRPEQVSSFDPFMGGTFRVSGLTGMRGGAAVQDTSEMGILTIAGRRPTGRFAFPGSGSFDNSLAFDVPKDLPPGKHELELTLELTPVARNGFVIINGRPQPPPGVTVEKRMVTLRVPVEVADESQQVVNVVALDEEKKKALAEKLRPSSAHPQQTLRQTTDSNGRIVSADVQNVLSLEFNVSDLPAPVAYEVFVRSNGKEQHLGSLTSGFLADQPKPDSMSSLSQFSWTVTINGRTQTSSSSSDLKNQRMVSGEFEGEIPAQIDVILRPSQRVGASTLDLKEFADTEIVFEGVDVIADQGSAGFGGISPFGNDPFGSDPFADIRRLQEESRRRFEELRRRSRPPATSAPPATQPEPTSPKGPM